MALINWNGQTFDSTVMSGGTPAINVPGSIQYQWNMAGRPGDPEQRQANISSAIDNLLNSVRNSIPKPDPSKEPKFADYFNEQLAKEAATKQYEPYYSQLLNRYIEDRNKEKTRIQEDYARGTISLEQATKETEESRRLGKESSILDYERAIREAEGGFAGRGLAQSGIRERGIRELKQTGEGGLRQYDIGTESAMRRLGETRQELGLGQQRGLENISSQLGRQTLDVGRQKEESILGNYLLRRGASQQNYATALQEYNKQYQYPVPDYLSTLSGQLSNILSQFR